MVIKIECDRRIRKLNIEFDDEFSESDVGFSEFTEYSEKPKKKSNAVPKKDKAISFDTEEQTEVTHEVIEKPTIEEKERAPLVAGEMQNLEF
jgi:hypothetical protein